MIFDVTTEKAGLKIGARGIEQIIQNVKVILATVKGSVPLDREFGVAADFLDSSLPVSRALYAAEAVRAVNAHEPRAEVVQVLWGEDQEGLMDGVMSPVVRIKIREGVEV